MELQLVILVLVPLVVAAPNLVPYHYPAADMVSSLVPVLRRALPAGQNALVSPLSVATVLAALDMGARGRTHYQLAALLHTRQPQVQLYGGLGDIVRTINKTKESQLANAVFVDKLFALDQRYANNVRSTLNAEVFDASFSSNPAAATGQVNQWVSRKTNGKIPTILPEASADTTVVLASALYFRGLWQQPFSKDSTFRRPFTISPQEVVFVDLMSNSADLPYGDFPSLKCKVLELPYAGGQYSMFLVLPHEGGQRALMDLESRLSQPQTLSAILNNLKVNTVDFSIPRLKLEASLDLNDALWAAGVTDIFDPTCADLSGILQYGSSSRQLSVSSVLHKVVIEVTEEGTEAAAAAATTVDRIGSRSLNFHANRPFLFVIQHKPTQTVLFWGSVVRPSPSFPAKA